MPPKKTKKKRPTATTVRKSVTPSKASRKSPATSPTDKEIAQAAYLRWLARGGEHGDHEKDWFEAEQELLEKKRAAGGPKNRSLRRK